MLIVGYCFGVRSERRLCEEVHLNLAYRRFCRLGLEGDIPDHSTFSKNRHGRFRASDLLRKLFETVVARCIKEQVVGGEAFAVDASMIVADAHRRRGVAKVEDLDPTSSRAVAEYLSVIDDAAFGGATSTEPKAISQTDPATRYTAAANTAAVCAYSDNYLVDLKHAVIMDVEATTAIRHALHSPRLHGSLRVWSPTAAMAQPRCLAVILSGTKPYFFRSVRISFCAISLFRFGWISTSRTSPRHRRRARSRLCGRRYSDTSHPDARPPAAWVDACATPKRSSVRKDSPSGEPSRKKP
jgi:IS5 family transposase